MNSRDVKTRNTKMDLDLEDINKFFKRHKEGYFWVQAGRGWLLKAEPGSQGGATDPCEVSSCSVGDGGDIPKKGSQLPLPEWA